MNNLMYAVAEMLYNGMATHDLFPYDLSPTRRNNKPHMKDTALLANMIVIDKDTVYFEIGNENAEEKTPHYHILEDAKIIRYANRGTDLSKGTQAGVRPKGKRDYGQWSYRRGTQPTTAGTWENIQEYRENMTRNFFGSGDLGSTLPREYAKRKAKQEIYNRNYYYNKHYQYIERILALICPDIAANIGARFEMGSDVSDIALERPTGIL